MQLYIFTKSSSGDDGNSLSGTGQLGKWAIDVLWCWTQSRLRLSPSAITINTLIMQLIFNLTFVFYLLFLFPSSIFSLFPPIFVFFILSSFFSTLFSPRCEMEGHVEYGKTAFLRRTKQTQQNPHGKVP